MSEAVESEEIGNANLLDMIEPTKCIQLEEGVYELKPCTTNFVNEGKDIPSTVVVTLGKRDRLLESYFRYVDLAKKFNTSSFDPNWLLTESETKIVQKSLIRVQAVERRLANFGITLSDVNTPEKMHLMDHPVVKAYLVALDDYDQCDIELTDRRLSRQKEANVLTVQQRHQIDVFRILTEEINERGEACKIFSEEEMLNTDFWAHQSDLILDCFHQIMKYILTELSIKVKKTEAIFVLCETVQELIAESVKGSLGIPKDTQSSNSSTSSQSTIQQGLSALEKATQSEK